MYLLDDLPYTGIEEDCEGLTDNLTPVVGVEGWTLLPSNDYKATMNALAKVCEMRELHNSILFRQAFLSSLIIMFRVGSLCMC